MSEAQENSRRWTWQESVLFIFAVSFVIVYVLVWLHVRLEQRGGEAYAAAAALLTRHKEHRLDGANLRVRLQRFVVSNYLRLNLVELWLSVLACALYVVDTYHTYTVTWVKNAEIGLSACFALDWVIYYIAAESRTRYFLSWTSVLDFLTVMPVFVSNVEGNESEGGATTSLIFLRFLRLVRIFRVLRLARGGRSSEAVRGSKADYEVFILCFTISAIIFIATSFYQISESSTSEGLNLSENEHFSIQWHEALYTVICIVLGRPLAPTSTSYSYTLLILLVGGSVALIGPAVARVAVAVASDFNPYGKPYPRNNPAGGHIIVGGQLTLRSVVTLVVELQHEDHTYEDIPTIVFLLSERPSPEIERYILSQGSERCHLIVSEWTRQSLIDDASVHEAQAVILMSTWQGRDQRDTDYATIAASLEVKLASPWTRVEMMLAQHESHEHVECLPGWSPTPLEAGGRSDLAVVNEDVRFASLSLSALCPGAVTFLNNLLSSRRLTSNPIAPSWLDEYSDGARMEVYQCKFGPALVGCSFARASNAIYEQLGVLLIAVVTDHAPGSDCAAAMAQRLQPSSSMEGDGNEVVEAANELLRRKKHTMTEDDAADTPIAKTVLPPMGKNANGKSPSSPNNPLRIILNPPADFVLESRDFGYVIAENERVAYLVRNVDPAQVSVNMRDTKIERAFRAERSERSKLMKSFSEMKHPVFTAVDDTMDPASNPLGWQEAADYITANYPTATWYETSRGRPIPDVFAKNWSMKGRRVANRWKLVRNAFRKGLLRKHNKGRFDVPFDLKGHILVCGGSPDGLESLLAALGKVALFQRVHRHDMKTDDAAGDDEQRLADEKMGRFRDSRWTVVVLSELPHDKLTKLTRFAHDLKDIYFISGSPLEVSDLKRARAEFASSCLVLSEVELTGSTTAGSKTASELGFTPDLPAALIVGKIARLNANAYVTVELQSKSSARFFESEDGMRAISEAANKADREARAGKFFDGIFKSNYTHWTELLDVGFTPSRASGRLFYNAVPDSLLVRSHYDPLIPAIFRLLMVPFSGVSSTPTVMRGIPSRYVGRPFVELKCDLARKGVVALALYRKPPRWTRQYMRSRAGLTAGVDRRRRAERQSVLDVLCGRVGRRYLRQDSMLADDRLDEIVGLNWPRPGYVYTNPPKDTIIHQGDSLLALEQMDLTYDEASTHIDITDALKRAATTRWGGGDAEPSKAEPSNMTEAKDSPLPSDSTSAVSHEKDASYQRVQFAMEADGSLSEVGSWDGSNHR